ncbi:DUF58 domain-containing protein, partial [bacterium]|nr:DUF58 domain-containing protein [bacterium]
LTLLARLYFKSRVELTVLGQEQTRIARSDVEFTISIRHTNVPPFYCLEIKPSFIHPLATPTFILRGRYQRQNLTGKIHFPHRGKWTVDHLRISLRDRLGLTQQSWKVYTPSEFKIIAAQKPIPSLPIAFSQSQEGDTPEDTRERSGEHFDIKPYAPSDGVRRLLWKTYARSGELFVRQPEPALFPEGEVAVFVVANKDEDYVVGAFMSYLEQLRLAQVECLLGTDVAANTLPLVKSGLNSKTSEQVYELLINYVFERTCGSGESFAEYLRELTNQKKLPERIIIFGPEERANWFTNISSQVGASTQASTKLSVALIKKGALPHSSGTNFILKNLPSTLHRILPLSYQVERPKQQAKTAQQITNAGAQLIICESAQNQQLEKQVARRDSAWH